MLAAEERRQAQELSALYAVSNAMDQALSDEDALTGALSRILGVLDLESGKIYFCDPRTAQLTLVAAQGNPEFTDLAETGITPGECLCGFAALISHP